MKIFDWVHRKMQTNMDYRKVPRHCKKDSYHVGDGRGSEDRGETKKGETEKAALLRDLHHVASLQQALDEILTIGTLGHIEYQHQEGTFLDAGTQLEFLSLPLAGSNKEEQRPSAAAAAAAAAEEAPDQEEKGEEPAVEAAAASAAHPNHNMVIESYKKEMLEILGANVTGSSGQNVAAGDQEGDLLEPLLQETKANRKERITLADLFMASEDDVHASMVEPTAGLKVAPASATAVPEKEAKIAATGTKAKPSSAPCRAKSGESPLTKKLKPWKKEGEDSSTPPQKLQRVIRRMLKKKIHPEMARDVDASVPSTRPGCGRTVSTGESASLIWYCNIPLITISTTVSAISHNTAFNTSQKIKYAANSTNCRI